MDKKILVVGIVLIALTFSALIFLAIGKNNASKNTQKDDNQISISPTDTNKTQDDNVNIDTLLTDLDKESDSVKENVSSPDDLSEQQLGL